MAVCRLSHTLKALQTLYPVELAGKWDNVGLLIDLATSEDLPLRRIFFCNDLVPRVLDEALALGDGEGASLIVTYHPTPFAKFKKVTMKDNVGKLILRCAASSVAVYSPHTACDCAMGGVNDWLATGVGGGTVAPIPPAEGRHADTGAGEGRTVKLEAPIKLSELIDRIKAHLQLQHVRVALAFDRFADGAKASDPLDLDSEVQTIGICAGSGSSVLGGVKTHVWLTGEMSHHEILAANAAGTTVILTDHSNTERGYLQTMSQMLQAELSKECEQLPEFVISSVDADPLVVL